MQGSQKIFGIGLSRTGTRTLHEAMLRLGYSSRHYVFDREILDFLKKDPRPVELRLSALDEFDALHDVPICAIYPALDRTYAGSKFILTVREKESWINSCRVHLASLRKSRRFPFGLRLCLEQFLPWRGENQALRTGWTGVVNSATYGIPYFHEAIFRRRYDEHLAEVKAYFAGREEDLLVLNICAGEGWEKLCPFLGRQIPAEAFPWEHRLATVER